ncbi:unnamed protein product [Durusdinium trenchii]|uniref:Uncharacterized protein n=1 Tax=Durusdinium trenchii TaxID=1381693 RepID=A0ABP0PXJ3_9DINO
MMVSTTPYFGPNMPQHVPNIDSQSFFTGLLPHLPPFLCSTQPTGVFKKKHIRVPPPTWALSPCRGMLSASPCRGFPTVRFHPYNSEDFEDFTAQRTAKNLLNFVEDRAQAPDGADAAVPPAAPAEVPAPVVAAKAPSEVKHTDATHESHEKHAPQEPHESHEADRVPAESESIKKPTSPSMKGEVAKVAAQVDDLKGPEQAMLPLPAPFAPPVQCRRLKDFL